MEGAVNTIVPIVSVVVALFAAIFAWTQAAAARRALRQSESALAHARVSFLFQGFDQASVMTLQYPSLLYDVHGLDPSVSEREARAVAYLSLLLDNFDAHYRELHKDDYAGLVEALDDQRSFLHQVLSVPANRRRWLQLKKLYYGPEFDREFTNAIDTVIARLQATNENLDVRL